jgi:predicted anti-sigma-YlaC factor YlaD
MTCGDVRDRLEAGGDAIATAPVREHLEGCESCAALARRWQAARGWLEARAEVEPDAAFAGRVAARVRGRTAATLGWAALRFMPAAFALLAVLAWLSLPNGGAALTDNVMSGGDVIAAAEEVDDDLLSWILDAGEVEP